ncbi:Pkinase-domain-containing protein, partial [Auricularia subglabra TFB-10046 SS5]
MPSPRSAQPHSRLLPNLTDTLIDHGRIHLLSIIGAGTYGVVYRALDVESDILRPRYFAVKCQMRAAEPRMKLHQQREIRLHKLASDHPGVVSLHRVVTERGFLFLVLDWCQDGDLFTVLTERNPFVGNDPVTKSAFLQLIDSVEYIHKMGIVHRDLKPENILCSGSQLLLTDFGLATADAKGREFECGSSYYMSPECVGDIFGRAEPFVYAPGDVWALGIMLINMSCARNPWGNASCADQCFRMFLHDPHFLRHKLPITRQMNDVLQRIFILDPHLRITLPQLRIAVV